MSNITVWGKQIFEIEIIEPRMFWPTSLGNVTVNAKWFNSSDSNNFFVSKSNSLKMWMEVISLRNALENFSAFRSRWSILSSVCEFIKHYWATCFLNCCESSGNSVVSVRKFIERKSLIDFHVNNLVGEKLHVSIQWRSGVLAESPRTVVASHSVVVGKTHPHVPWESLVLCIEGSSERRADVEHTVFVKSMCHYYLI